MFKTHNKKKWSIPEYALFGPQRFGHKEHRKTKHIPEPKERKRTNADRVHWSHRPQHNKSNIQFCILTSFQFKYTNFTANTIRNEWRALVRRHRARPDIPQKNKLQKRHKYIEHTDGQTLTQNANDHKASNIEH